MKEKRSKIRTMISTSFSAEARHSIRNVINGIIVVGIIALGFLLLIPGLLISNKNSTLAKVQDHQEMFSWVEEAKLTSQLKNMSDEYSCYVSIITSEPSTVSDKVYGINDLSSQALRIGIARYGGNSYKVVIYNVGIENFTKADRLLIEENMALSLEEESNTYQVVAHYIELIEHQVFLHENVTSPELQEQATTDTIVRIISIGLLLGLIFAGVFVATAIVLHKQKYQAVRASVYIQGNQDQYGFTVTQYDTIYLGSYEEVLPNYYGQKK